MGGTDETDPIAVYFDGDGALQKAYGNDQAVALLDLNENALEAFKRAVVDANDVSDFDEGPGLGGQAGLDDGVDGVDFAVIDRDRNSGDANDVDQGRSSEDVEPVVGIEAAEDIAGKERQIGLLGTVQPAAARAGKGQEFLIALVVENGCGDLLAARFDAQGRPARVGTLLGLDQSRHERSETAQNQLERSKDKLPPHQSYIQRH